MSFPVWTYWGGFTGPPPPVIQLCIESQKRHHSDHVTVDNAWVAAHDGQYLLDATRHHIPSAIADVIRFWLLATRGGLWFDSDCLVLKHCTLYDSLTGEAVMGCPRSGGPRCFSNTIAALRDTPMSRQAFESCFQFLSEHRPGFSWADSADGVLESLYLYWTGEGRMIVRPNGIQFLSGFDHNANAWKTDDQHFDDNHWADELEVAHLCQAAYRSRQAWTREAVLRDRSFVGYLFRRAFGLPPDNSPVPYYPGGAMIHRFVKPDPARREAVKLGLLQKRLKRLAKIR